MNVLAYVLVAIAGYLIGSFPSGLVAGRLVRGQDIRQTGSGRLGATNAFRALGPRAALAVGLADVFKGALPVLLAGWILGESNAQAIAGLAAAIGHNWPIFADFRGGRGTATSWGALMAMNPYLGSPVGLVFALTLFISRYASLASLFGAVAAIVLFSFGYLSTLVPLSYFIYAWLGSLLLVVRHRDNIERLRAGKERRLGQPVERSAH